MVSQQLARRHTPRLGARVVCAGRRVAHESVRRHAVLSEAAFGSAGTAVSVLHEEQPASLSLVRRQRCCGGGHGGYSERCAGGLVGIYN